MFIQQLHLQNFKRFTDVKIDLSDAKTPPKLVLLIGTNGCGKSSVFDSFEYIAASSKYSHKNIEPEYYTKNGSTGDMRIALTDTDGNSYIYTPQGGYICTRDVAKYNFYGRSAFRYTSTLKKKSLGTHNIDITSDQDRPLRYIDTDENRFENDIEVELQKMIESIQEIDFDDASGEEKTSYFDIMDQTIRQPMNDSLSRIFAHEGLGIRMVGLTPPGGTKTTDMIFRKGNTKKIRYNYLSAGEKEIINILFDIYVKKSYYTDTIYFLDELDTHLNTSLQYTLIQEIVRILPDNCQLWTATHSLGFIDFAKYNAESVIIDFNEKNFDETHILYPKKKYENDLLHIAIPASMMTKIFANKKIVYCENTNDEYYNGLGLSDIIFSGETNRDAVFLRLEKEGATKFGLIDRDFLSDQERSILIEKVPGLKILEYYCFENYLYHPDNLIEYIPDFPVALYKQAIIDYKNTHLSLLGGKITRSRQNMIFLKDQKHYFTKKDTVATEGILHQKIQSNDFVDFYPIFSMKDFDKSFLQGYTFDILSLTQTKWFVQHIAHILQ